MQTDITTKCFKKNLTKAILFLVMTIVLIILASLVIIVVNILASSSPLFTVSDGVSIASTYSPAIVLSILLIIFAAVGKANATKNRTMAFVFGILTLILVAILIGERGYRLYSLIVILVDDIKLVPSLSSEAIFVGIRAGMIAATAIIIAFGIVSIVTSVTIIKENVPKGASSTTTTKTTPQVAPATTVAPKAIKSIAPSTTPQFCDGCGSPLNAGAKFCESCGKSVE